MTQGRRSAEWDLTVRPSGYDGVFASYSLLHTMQSKKCGQWRIRKPILSPIQYLFYKLRLKDRGIHYCK
jgi:hypothetical protein